MILEIENNGILANKFTNTKRNICRLLSILSQDLILKKNEKGFEKIIFNPQKEEVIVILNKSIIYKFKDVKFDSFGVIDKFKMIEQLEEV